MTSRRPAMRPLARIPAYQAAGTLPAVIAATASIVPEVIVVDDGSTDGQRDPGEVPRLLECWRRTGAAMVIGSRAHLEEGMTPARRFGNRFACRAVSYFAGVTVADTQSGFRLYEASLLRALPLRGVRYEMESEVTVKAARAGVRVESTPVRLARVGGADTSHFRPWRDTARICLAVLRSRYWD